MVAFTTRMTDAVTSGYQAFSGRLRGFDSQVRVEEKEPDLQRAVHDRHRIMAEKVERLRAVFDQVWMNGACSH